MYAVQATATAHGFIFEDMMLHQSIDMQVNNGYQWTSPGGAFTKPFGLANFDGFDSTSVGGAYSGGVFTFNNGAWSDLTECAYLGAVKGCLPATGSIYYGNPTIGGTLYIGYQVPFDQVNFGTLQAAGAGGSVAFNYWNGNTWTPFTSNFTDGTAGLTTAGRVHFYPPSDWSPTALSTGTPYNNGYAKYWVQIVVSGAATSPVFGTITGDDWSVSSSGNNTRGWNSTDSHRINVGTPLEYNPTPPPNASAHFRYQARVTGIWAPNYMVGNHSNFQNGKYTWAQYLADTISAYNKTNLCTTTSGGPAHCNYDAVFYDDAGAIATQIASPSFSGGGMPWTFYDYTRASTDTGLSVWQSYVTKSFQQIKSDLKAIFGNEFQVGFNSGPWSLAQNVDFDFVEGWLMNTWDTHAKFQPSPYGPTYDASLPANNPNGTRLIITCGDYLQNWTSSQNIGFSYWHYVDLANRTPISCLAQHWLGWNNKTSFAYHTVGYGWYTDLDEAYTLATPTTTTNAISPCTTGGCTTTITLADASHCTTGISAPDYIALSQNNSCPAPSYRSSWRVGSPTSGDTFDGCLNGNTLTTVDNIYNSYPAGANAYCITTVHQSVTSPALANVYKWGSWFPARGVDIGAPNASGYRSGARAVTESGNTPYLYGGSPDYISGMPQATCNAGQCSDVWRRDFTKAIVLFRPWTSGYVEAELDTPSQPIELGGTYYPLLADGTTGPGVTSIRLRGAEGAILMIAPR